MSLAAAKVRVLQRLLGRKILRVRWEKDGAWFYNDFYVDALEGAGQVRNTMPDGSAVTVQLMVDTSEGPVS